ncbi:hypothetical protein BV22DRAFT_986875, partial [Leucogyrophana mollusca]
WATYQREADEYDSEFLRKYQDDTDMILVFAGIFSVVSAIFITSMQSKLSADPTTTTNALLMHLVHAVDNSAISGQNPVPPAWNGPGSTVIWSQSLMYASLCANLLAAFGGVLGKQWLSHYRRREIGMIEEHAKRRQQKLNGLEAWHFQAVLEVLPVLLQTSFLLFGIALTAHAWTLSSTIGAVAVGITAFGILFYISITIASLVFSDCPFQTPMS